MLAELRIKNYALIDDLEINYPNGLNVLTGETGAGKSIVIDAFSLLLGERAESEMVRTGAAACEVEGTFMIKPGSLADSVDFPIEQSETMLIRRKVEANGRSYCYINDRSVTSNTLKRLGDYLVDLHGQHEHQSLLRIESHQQLLDDFANLEPKRQDLKERFLRYQSQKAELENLRAQIQKRKERQELDQYQHQEIASAQLKPGERESILKEKILLENAEQRHRLAQELNQMLSENEGSILEQFDILQRRGSELVNIDDSLAEPVKELNTARSIIDELWRTIVKYRDRIEFSPQRLEALNERLFLIEKLQKKYNRDIEGLLALQKDLAKRLGSLEIDQTRIIELSQGLETKRSELVKKAKELSGARLQAKKRIEARLERELSQLGMAQARFVAAIEPVLDEAGIYEDSGKRYRLDENGIDKVEFLFSANPGEEPKPLRKIASGGELSRIMLALKSVISDKIPVLVFDEIDLGIGGRVADAVGRKLFELSRTRQVICITHLPQIAKYAGAHYLVTKRTRSGRTATNIERLSERDRVNEIARMLAGEKISKKTLSHAQELLKEVKT
ncbi:MAG: DNA repair protein RecN [candidate division WOR-3 bacterium]|nr:DNA repair protein RecN [candidate division WOR-3 bacterium]